MLGASLALVSAATFGLNNAALRRGVLTGSVLQAMAITVPVGVPLFLVVCMLIGGLPTLLDYGIPGFVWMALAGVIHFVVGRYGNYKATQLLGAALSGPIQQFSIIVSLALALAFLGEVLTPLRVLGIVLVMVGPLVMLRRKRGRLKSSAGFEPDIPRGLAWGAVCALGYGSSPLFIRLGLDAHDTMTASIAGALISYGAASLVIVVLVALAGGATLLTSIDGTALRWFSASAVLVFVSQMFRYMALAVAPVGVVVPIQRLSVAFRVVFSWLLNQEHEVLNANVVIGIVISILGATALTLSTDFVAHVLPLPDQIQGVIALEWPAR